MLIRLVPAILALLCLAAHFYRAAQPSSALFFLLVPLILFVRRRWVPTALRSLLCAGSGLWLVLTYQLVQQRLTLQLPWLRLAVILVAVSAFTALAAWLVGSPRVQQRYQR